MTLALKVIAGEGEIEQRAFGSTLKTLSRYLLHGGVGYWASQAALDFAEVPKAHSSPLLRRLGPLAKVPLWLILRLRRVVRGSR